MTRRYQLVRRESARRWHLAGERGRALCGVAVVHMGDLSPVATRATDDLRELTCPDCLAILVGKAR